MSFAPLPSDPLREQKVMMRRAGSVIVNRERNDFGDADEALVGATPQNKVRAAIIGSGWGLRVQLPKAGSYDHTLKSHR